MNNLTLQVVEYICTKSIMHTVNNGLSRRTQICIQYLYFLCIHTGVAAGSLLGGYGFRNFGGSLTFFYTGIVSLAIGMLNCVINIIITSRTATSL